MATVQQEILNLLQARGIDPASVNMQQLRQFAANEIGNLRSERVAERDMPRLRLDERLAEFMAQADGVENVSEAANTETEVKDLPPLTNNPNTPAVSTDGAVRVNPSGTGGGQGGVQNAPGATQRTQQEREDDLAEVIQRELSGSALPDAGGGSAGVPSADGSDDGSGIPILPLIPAAAAGRNPQQSNAMTVIEPDVVQARMTGIHYPAGNGGEGPDMIDGTVQRPALPAPQAALPAPNGALPPPAAGSVPNTPAPQAPSGGGGGAVVQQPGSVGSPQAAAPAPTAQPAAPAQPQSPVDANIEASMQTQPDRAATVQDLLGLGGPTGPTTNLGGPGGNAPRIFGGGPTGTQLIEANGSVYPGNVSAQQAPDGSTRYVTDDGRVFDNAGRFIGQVGDSLQQIMRNLRGAL